MRAEDTKARSGEEWRRRKDERWPEFVKQKDGQGTERKERTKRNKRVEEADK